MKTDTVRYCTVSVQINEKNIRNLMFEFFKKKYIVFSKGNLP